MHILFLSLFGFTLVSPALAYVGPGPGLNMLGSLFTLLAGVGIALFFVLFYPIRLYLKRKKAPENKEDDKA